MIIIIIIIVIAVAVAVPHVRVDDAVDRGAGHESEGQGDHAWKFVVSTK